MFISIIMYISHVVHTNSVEFDLGGPGALPLGTAYSTLAGRIYCPQLARKPGTRGTQR